VLGSIGSGLLVYLGVAPADTHAEAQRLAQKVAGLRIFRDEQDKMNLSVLDVGGAVLAISNFTLLADASRGRRPSFVAAAGPDLAQPLYEAFMDDLRKAGCRVEAGRFGATMEIDAVAAGPVNVLIDMEPQEDSTSP
jgi:D-tyrosyl-tRNA(Tyr) deacylase